MQKSFSELEYAAKKKVTRRDRFLAEIDALTPWKALLCYDSQAIRGVVGIDLSREASPDAATLLKFRHLLEQHGLTRRIFKAINAHLAKRGLFILSI